MQLYWKRGCHKCFPVNFAKFLRASFEHLWTAASLTTSSETSNTKYLELIKKRSKVQEDNMSCKCALNFDQSKTISENYEPMRVWLWLVHKFTKNYQIYRLFSKFIQTKKRYPTSLDKKKKKKNPNSEIICHIKLKCFLWT